ncbi:MAG: type II secretion system protein [Terrimicrobiaceae bacterium]|nr:type II secretion system protein [Terrimicrobiaceae bacterium]
MSIRKPIGDCLSNVMNGRSRGGAFTLVEMLVVVAIVMILAALLFPAFATIRARADAAKCLSQLRQVGTAISLYVSENNGTLPGPLWSTQPPLAARDNNNVTWLGGFLAPYLGVQLPNGPTTTFVTVPTMFCPVNLQRKVSRGTGMWTVNGSVDVNGLTRSPWGHPSGVGDLRTPARMSSISNVASTWALQERDLGNPAAVVHRTVRNTLFFDWHVESVRVP